MSHFKIGNNSIKKYLTNLEIQGQTGVSFDVIFYFQTRTIEKIISTCLQSDEVVFVVADYFLGDNDKKSAVTGNRNILNKSNLLNIFKNLGLSYYRIGHNVDNQVIYMCEK